MEKIVYIGTMTDGNATEVTGATFDLSEARKKLAAITYNLTSREKITHTACISGYMVPVVGTAEESFNAFQEDLCWLPDPDFYEDIDL